ncbi:craniofacial development protein 2-like [Montipora capricornis]|uniref:craniofacial development protein 2-like n=1 Tax=Montipora capricornis TaxID=246305 RepID=UPI0035F1F2E7
MATPKSVTRIGCWNVRTMYIAGKATQVAREMDRYQLDVLGISETILKGAGRVTLANGSTLLYAGEEEGHQKGVALMISQEAQRSLMEWMHVSSRVISARFYSRFKKITIIQAYAPTNDATPEEKDDFYHQLQTTTDRCNKNDIVIVMGDMNAKVGDDNRINKTSDEIRRRRWNWIGHVLRKDATDNCRVALGWQLEGKRAVGRPKTTWRRTVENERKSEGWNSWREVKVIAEDRVGCKTRVAALCASWRGEI